MHLNPWYGFGMLYLLLPSLLFLCGYLITFCSIILLLIIYKTGRASKSLVWVWGVTPAPSLFTFSLCP